SLPRPLGRAHRLAQAPVLVAFPGNLAALFPQEHGGMFLRLPHLRQPPLRHYTARFENLQREARRSPPGFRGENFFEERQTAELGLTGPKAPKVRNSPAQVEGLGTLVTMRLRPEGTP